MKGEVEIANIQQTNTRSNCEQYLSVNMLTWKWRPSTSVPLPLFSMHFDQEAQLESINKTFLGESSRLW